MYHYHHTDFSLFNSNRWSIFIKYFAKYELSKNDLKRKLFCHLASKRRITFVTSALFFEKIAKIVINLSGGCSTTLSWAFHRVSMDYGKRRNFTKKKKKMKAFLSEDLAPVPLKVVWMGFEPLINVLKGLISNQSNSKGWVANDGKFIPNVLLRNKSML